MTIRNTFAVPRIARSMILSAAATCGLSVTPPVISEQITVDEATFRAPGGYEGPLPLVAAAFAACGVASDDLLPTGDGETWIIQTLFDTGALPSVNPQIGSQPGVLLGARHADALGLPTEQFGFTGDSCVIPLLSSYNAINQVNSEALTKVVIPTDAKDANGNLITLQVSIAEPNHPSPEQAAAAWWERVTFDNGRTTLIGPTVINGIRTLIDNRPSSIVTREFSAPEGRAILSAPHFLFNPSEAEVTAGPISVTLGLLRILDDNPSTTDRWQLHPVRFRNEGLSVESAPTTLQFLFDTGTVYSAITLDLAQELGLLDRDRDFTCKVNGFTYNGYIIGAVEMDGFVGDRDNYQDLYNVKNARICVEDANPTTPRIIKRPGDGSIADYQAVIGSNLFEQVRVLLDGPKGTLTILTDPGDFDGNTCIDRGDYGLLMVELRKPTQAAQISGYVEVGTETIFIGEGGEAFMVPSNFTATTFTANGPVQIASAMFDFNGRDVILDADGSASGIEGCGTSFQRIPDPLTDDTHVFGFTVSGFEPGTNCRIPWDFDKMNKNLEPTRNDLLGANVIITFNDGSTTTAILNQNDSENLARNENSAAGRFALSILDFREPPSKKFDLNGDGIVNRADARTLVGLFTNPRGASCD